MAELGCHNRLFSLNFFSDGLSDSARNLTERLARLKYQEFAERVERIHNQWVEAVNKTLDELMGLRGDLASARYQRTPPEKRQICETPEEVDKVFAEMMD